METLHIRITLVFFSSSYVSLSSSYICFYLIFKIAFIPSSSQFLSYLKNKIQRIFSFVDNKRIILSSKFVPISTFYAIVFETLDFYQTTQNSDTLDRLFPPFSRWKKEKQKKIQRRRYEDEMSMENYYAKPNKTVVASTRSLSALCVHGRYIRIVVYQMPLK